jgi:mannose-6-phosphate isomerase-like protein (cupin superfamily)
VAGRADQTLVEEHDEGMSGQQELYLILEGEAAFQLDGEQAHFERGTALAVTDPSVRRSARAVTLGTVLLVVGASSGPFASTWNPAHFSDVDPPE